MAKLNIIASGFNKSSLVSKKTKEMRRRIFNKSGCHKQGGCRVEMLKPVNMNAECKTYKANWTQDELDNLLKWCDIDQAGQDLMS